MGRIRNQKSDLIREHERLMAQRTHWTDMVKRLHDHVLKVNKTWDNMDSELIFQHVFDKLKILVIFPFQTIRNWDTIRICGSYKWIITDKYIFYQEVSHRKRTHQR